MDYEERGRIKPLLLDLVNRAVPHPDYKGGVAFLPGDARIIKKKIASVNDLLSNKVGPIWPYVVIPDDKGELCKLLSKLTSGQQSCITLCYGRVEKMTDNSTIARAIRAARKAVEANERAEEDILSAHTTQVQGE